MLDSASPVTEPAEAPPATRPGARAPLSAPAFTPVSVRHRADGWTPERQRVFIEFLAETGSVRWAAGQAGMTEQSAYRLWLRHDAQSFAHAWDAAVRAAVRMLADKCLERAIHGVDEPIYYREQIIGCRRRYFDGLSMFMLRSLDPATFGAPGRRAAAPEPLTALLRLFPLLLNRLLRRGRPIDPGKVGFVPRPEAERWDRVESEARPKG